MLFEVTIFCCHILLPEVEERLLATSIQAKKSWTLAEAGKDKECLLPRQEALANFAFSVIMKPASDIEVWVTFQADDTQFQRLGRQFSG